MTDSTVQQEREGKSHVGAYRKRESTKAMAGRNARKQTARGHRAAVARARKADGHTRQELYEKGKTATSGRALKNDQAATGKRIGTELSTGTSKPGESALMHSDF